MPPSPLLTLAAAAVLLAAAWPFGALWRKRLFRRAFPKLAAYLLIALAGYTIAIVVLALVAPRVTLGIAAVALVVLAAQAWRSRAAFGRKRGLPPGELTLLPVGAWTDQAFFAKQGERYGPVFKTSHFTQPMVCIIGLETGLEILRRHEDSAVVPPEAAFARYIPCSYIRSMSPENHQRYRPILQAAVSSAVNELRAPEVRAIIARHLDRMAREDGKHLAPYAREALYEILFYLFFGIPPRSADQHALREIYRVLDLSHQRRVSVWAPSDRTVQATLQRTLQLLQPYVEAIAADASRAPSAPPRSYLEAAWRHGGRAAVDEVVLLNLIYLLQVTCTDLTGLFDWILKKLSDHPDWQTRLRATIEQHGFESAAAIALGRRIVSETFRLDQSEHIYRKVVKPMEFAGYRIPSGWLLRICVRESHRSSPAFVDPDSFNPDRFLDRAYGPTEYAPFGLGRRRCIGVNTGLALGGLLAQTLVDGSHWEVIDPGTPEFRGWHWTPGGDFAIRLSRASTVAA